MNTAKKYQGKNIFSKSSGLYVVVNFKGKRMPERVTDWPNGKAAQKRALNIANEKLTIVKHEIARYGDDFNYAKYFPNSSRLGSFGFASNERLDELIEHWEAWHKTRKPQVIPTSRDTLKRQIMAFSLYAKNPTIKEITTNTLNNFFDSKVMKANSRKTKANYCSAIRGFLDFAIERGLLKENPAQPINFSADGKGSTNAAMKKLDEGEAVPFKREEVAAILKAETEPAFHNFIKFGFFSGLRLSEICGLCLDAVEFRNDGTAMVSVIRQVSARAGKNHDYNFNYPKSASVRHFWLHASAVEALKDQIKLIKDKAPIEIRTFRSGGRKAGEIFTESVTPIFFSPNDNINHGYIKNVNNIGRSFWRKALEKAGLEYKEAYQMRHTFASQLLTGGVDIAEVSRILGHNNIATTKTYYANWIKEDLPDNSSALTKAFSI